METRKNTHETRPTAKKATLRSKGMKAAEAYTATMKETLGAIEALKNNLLETYPAATHEAMKTLNWDTVGSLKHVLAEIKDLNAFVTGEER